MEPTFKRVQGLRSGLETVYGTRPALDATDAIFFSTCSIKPNFTMVDRKTAKNYMGASEKIPVGNRFDISLELELQSSGTQGTAPAIGEYLLCSGHAETTVAVGSAGLTQTSPPTAVGTVVGVFTYAKTVAPVVTLPRIVTLECTTPGDSGVAAFSVSAPAVGDHVAYSALAQVMTSATPFALCNTCTITPTVTTPFALGDTFTIKLMPPHVYYTPITEGFGSNGGLMHYDGRAHDFSGARYNAEISLPPQQPPSLKLTGMGIYGGISAETAAPAATLTRWKKPVGVNAANTSAATLHGLDLTMSEFSFNAGSKVADQDLPGQHQIILSDRAADSCSITVQSPPFADWDYHESVRQVLLGGVAWTHGTEPGFIVAFEAPTGQVSEPDIVDVNGVNFAKFKLGLIPSDAGNDEYKLYFY